MGDIRHAASGHGNDFARRRHQHRSTHAALAVGVIYALHIQNTDATAGKRNIERFVLDHIRQRPRLDGDRIQHRVTGRRCHHRAQGFVTEVEHVHAVHGCAFHGLLTPGQRVGGLLRLRRCPADERAIGAIPQRIGCAVSAVLRNTHPEINRLCGWLTLTTAARRHTRRRFVVLGEVLDVNLHERAALVRARQRHERGKQLAIWHFARMQVAVARAVCAVQHKKTSAVRVGCEDTELVALANMVPARIHDFAGRQHRGVAVVTLVEGNLAAIRAIAVHHVQHGGGLALVFVEIGEPISLLRLHLAVRGEDDAAVGEIRWVKIVASEVTGRGSNRTGDRSAQGLARNIVFPDPPTVRGRAAHAEQQFRAIVRNFGIGDVTLPLGLRTRDVDRRRARRGFLADVEVAASREHGGIGRIAERASGTRDIGNGYVAVDRTGIGATASGKQREQG